MHLPDTAIRPAASIAAWAFMIPAWYAAGRKLRAHLASREVPLLAIGSAFSFTIMLFNIPVLGGTTVHPVGAVLLAILLGPEAAIAGVSIALAIQALFFADGGVLALALNSFTMAFAMPVCGYAAYRAIAAGSPAESGRRIVAAGIGGGIGLNVAALLTALLLGIQPPLARAFGGTYFPFGLRVTIPALLLPHLAIGGVAEGIITAAAYRALVAAGVVASEQATPGVQERGDGRAHGRANGRAPGRAPERTIRARIDLLWLGLALLAALAPIGILAKGAAWGEGGTEGGGAAAGIFRIRPPLPGYLAERGALFYALAGSVGAALIAAVLLVLGRAMTRRRTTAEAFARIPASVRLGEVPAWLLARGGGNPPRARSPWRSRPSGSDLIARTLRALTRDAHETLFAERWARERGLLQQTPPAAKLPIILAIVAAIPFLQSPLILAALCLVAFALAVLSRIPPRTFTKRAWLALPVFVGAFAVPAMTSWVSPGRVLLVLSRSLDLEITRPGVERASVLALRAVAAVSFTVLLALTTRWRDLIAALRLYRCPAPVVDVLAMAHRYAALLTRAAADVFTARRSRAVGREGNGVGRGFVAAAIAGLFVKSIALAGDVHEAMLARGWGGRGR